MTLVGAFDLETTGVESETDRIVSAAFVVVGEDGTRVDGHEWLVNPGVEIPASATEVHGITNERVQAEGMPPAQALNNMLLWFNTARARDVPIVVFNAPYDLTMFDREFRRHNGRGITPDTFGNVLDPMIIDKAIDRYRKGKRTLTVTAAHYGIPEEGDAHSAAADALMAGRLAQAMLQKLGDSPEDLHRRQIVWARERAESFQDYLRREKGDPSIVINPEWPMHILDEKVIQT